MELENTFTVPAGIEEAWAAFNDPRRVAPCFPGATLESYEDDSFTGTVKVKLGPISLTYKGKGTFVERDDKAHKVVIEASGRDSRGNGTAKATVTGTLTAEGDSRTTVTMVTDMTVTGRPAQFGRGVMADVSDKIVGQFSSCLASKLGPGDDLTPAEGAKPAARAKPAAEAEPAIEAVPAAEAEPARAGESAPPEVAAAAGSPAGPGTAAAAGSAPVAGSAGVATVTATPASTSNGSGPTLADTQQQPARGEVDAIDLLDAAGSPLLKRVAPVAAGVVLLLILLRVLRSRRS